MTRTRLALILLPLLLAAHAYAGGPIAPEGWDGSFEPMLPNGQPCCVSADLNGTGLVGGAFVFLSTDKHEFALFVLSYTPPMQERWQLLEKHPIEKLDTFRVMLVPPGELEHGAIEACGAGPECRAYATASAKDPFKKVKRKPAP